MTVRIVSKGATVRRPFFRRRKSCPFGGPNAPKKAEHVAKPVAVSAAGAKFTAVASGQAFNLALDDAGDVWSWGWAEHGVIGNGTDGRTCETAHASCARRRHCRCGCARAHTKTREHTQTRKRTRTSDYPRPLNPSLP